MSDTREKILYAALRLFARDGYEAVPVSRIAGELGMTKGALYRHYQSKRDIFDQILARMEQMDYESAVACQMPAGTMEQDAEAYGRTSVQAVRTYAKAQFRYWTENEFSANFRKMLTLEQYRDGEMAQLYQQYLVSGPLGYMADIFSRITGDPEAGMGKALAFYGPFFLMYGVYDGAEDKQKVRQTMERYIDGFIVAP